MKLVEKMNGIMEKNIKEKNTEWCTDSLLEMMTELLHQAADLSKAKPSSPLP